MKENFKKVFEGCYTIFILLGYIMGLLGAVIIFFVTPFSSVGLVDLWVIITTLALPVVYIIGFIFGRKQTKTTIPDANPDNPDYYAEWMAEWFENKFIGFFASLAIVAIICSIVVFSISSYLVNLNANLRLLWASLSTSGLMILAFLGYWLGCYPMEDRRKIGLAIMPWIFFLVFGPFAVELISENNYFLENWLGIGLGITGGILTITYLSHTWDPSKLESTPGCLDSGIGLFGILVGSVLIFLFFDEKTISSILGPWSLLILGYFIIQSWRHRPR